MKSITDRIAKAVELIDSGKVYKHTDYTFCKPRPKSNGRYFGVEI